MAVKAEYNPDRKSYIRYHRTKGLFNKRAMKLIKRNRKNHKRTPLQKLCNGKLDDSCIMRAMKSNNPHLRKSANFVQTMRKIAGRRVGKKDKYNMSKRKKKDKMYNLQHRQDLRRVERWRKLGGRKR